MHKPHAYRDDRFYERHHPMEERGEVIIDADYDKFLKVPDVLYDCQIPESKVLPQAAVVKSETKKINMGGMNQMKFMMFGHP